MFLFRTLLMTAAVISFGLGASAQAAGLISSTTSGVSVNTPAANVGVNANVNADSSVNTGHASHPRKQVRTETDTRGYAGVRAYNDESVRNEQMRQDMNNNDDVHAGMGVSTRSSFNLND